MPMAPNTSVSFTDSVGSDAFTFGLYLEEDGQRLSVRARAGKGILDRNDGSYILRFRLHRSYANMKIQIMHKGKHVAESPYTIEGV